MLKSAQQMFPYNIEDACRVSLKEMNIWAELWLVKEIFSTVWVHIQSLEKIVYTS